MKLVQKPVNEIYTVSLKNRTLNLPITSKNVNQYLIFFTDRLTGKFATELYLNIPPHLKYVAILPCEIRWWQCEICIVIYDKSQDTTAKHLNCDVLLHCKFITQFAGERIFKISEHLAKLQAKWLIVSYTHSPGK